VAVLSTETPKASREREMKRGHPLPSRLRGLGSVVGSPSGAQGGAQAENEFLLVHFELEKRI